MMHYFVKSQVSGLESARGSHSSSRHGHPVGLPNSCPAPRKPWCRHHDVDARPDRRPAQGSARAAATIHTMRVVILGAGFGGLELATRLSEEFAEDADVV